MQISIITFVIRIKQIYQSHKFLDNFLKYLRLLTLHLPHLLLLLLLTLLLLLLQFLHIVVGHSIDIKPPKLMIQLKRPKYGIIVIQILSDIFKTSQNR